LKTFQAYKVPQKLSQLFIIYFYRTMTLSKEYPNMLDFFGIVN
jgi:hypothetical protein